MESDDKFFAMGFFLGAFLAVLCAIAIGSAIDASQDAKFLHQLREEAMASGSGEYFLDENHNRQWRWLPKPGEVERER